jgi:hypothetical protein
MLETLVTMNQTGEDLSPENITSHIATSFVQNNFKKIYAQACLPIRALFLNVMPCSPVKVSWRFGGTCRFHLQDRRDSQARNNAAPFMLVSCFAYSSALKMEATCSSEMSLDFYRNTRYYNLEARTVYNHRCENLKSNMSDCCSEHT